jgi:transposase
MKIKQLNLLTKQKEELKSLHRSVGDKRIADRIKAIILFSDGYSKSEIEKILLIERRSIGKYIKRYVEKGIDALLVLNYRGSAPKLSQEEMRLLRKELNDNLYCTAAEVCDFVKKRFKKSYKPESMVKLLNRIGFSYKKTKRRPSKADRKAQESFLDKYNELRTNLAPDESIYFIDAVHPQHNSIPYYAWIEKGKEKEILSNSGRQRVNINGAYNPVTQAIITRQDDSINAQSTIGII